MKRYELRITPQGNGGAMIPDETGGWVMYRSVKELETLVAQQAAVIAQMREALQAADSWYRSFANLHHRGVSNQMREALAIQPCPEVLNKVRADAVGDAIDAWMRSSAYVNNENIELWFMGHIQRIEKGEM